MSQLLYLDDPDATRGYLLPIPDGVEDPALEAGKIVCDLEGWSQASAEVAGRYAC